MEPEQPLDRRETPRRPFSAALAAAATLALGGMCAGAVCAGGCGTEDSGRRGVRPSIARHDAGASTGGTGDGPATVGGGPATAGGADGADGGADELPPAGSGGPFSDAPSQGRGVDPTAVPGLRLEELREGRAAAAAPGLPAVSADGAELAVAVLDDGQPGLEARLAVRFVAARTGRTVQQVELVNAQEAERLQREGAEFWRTLEPGVARRAELVRARLRHGGFRPLPEIAIDPGIALGDAPFEAEGAGVRVRFDPEKRTLDVRDSGGGPLRLLSRLEPAPPRYAFCGEVFHAPRPTGAWVDGKAKVYVLRVSYLGDEGCGAPPDAYRAGRLFR